MYLENVNGRMSKKCEFCSKEPKEERFVLEDKMTNRYGTVGKRVFCNETHFKKWVKKELNGE